jgi:hypothetical protein
MRKWIQANRSAPPCVNFTNVPLSCISSQPRSFVAKQERAVEFLDIDAAILHRLEGVRVLHQTARSFVGIAIEAVGGVFHQFLMQPRPRCYRAFMCSDRPNAVQRKMVAWRRWLVPRPLKSAPTEVYLTDVTPQKIDLDQF